LHIAERLSVIKPYLFSELRRKIARAKQAGVDVISLAIGDPVEPTPAPVIEELCATARDPANHPYPTGEERGMPVKVRARYAGIDSMVEAFREAWAFVALQNASGVTGQRLSTRGLAEELERDGWDAVTERYRGKLTKAVYEQYDFPKRVRYQTPSGWWKELRFE